MTSGGFEFDHRKLCVTRFPALFCFKKKIVAAWHLGEGRRFRMSEKLAVFRWLRMTSAGGFGFDWVIIENCV